MFKLKICNRYFPLERMWSDCLNRKACEKKEIVPFWMCLFCCAMWVCGVRARAQIVISVVRNFQTARFKSVVHFITLRCYLLSTAAVAVAVAVFSHFSCEKSELCMCTHLCVVRLWCARCIYLYRNGTVVMNDHMGQKWVLAPPQHHIFRFCQRISMDFHKN